MIYNEVNILDNKSIKKEINTLIKKGEELSSCLLRDKDTNEYSKLDVFIGQYEIWYTKALAIIKLLAPDRMQDFTLLYSNPKRKELDSNTYCISDALRNTTHMFGEYGPSDATMCVVRQLGILRACVDNLDSIIHNIQTILQADIFDSEIETAKHLLKKGFLRASGVICGVIIEKHLASVCSAHNIKIVKKNPTIADFNDTLKDQIYDVIEWRRIQRLGDIRNLCGHNKDREPTADEVSELISGTERTIMNIF